MITTKPFFYDTSDFEDEKASNAYLMSLVAIVAGLPLPIINLIATLFFYVGNRKGTYYVRWHCMQALLSQVSVLFINSAAFWWTVSIVFGNEKADNDYFAYLFVVLFFNLIEFITTIYTAVKTRKGIHVEWWFYSGLTNALVSSKK